MIKNKKTVLVGVSGGMDSSFAIKILLEKYNVIGVFLRLGNNDIDENHARRVCDFFKIKFYPIDVSIQFKKEVIDYFLNAYNIGETPNPCIKCNKFIKFKTLIKISDQLGCDFVATGHYAQIKNKNKIFSLFKSIDSTKDQTYFLYNLTQEDLSKIIFPLGSFLKTNIKKEVEKGKIPCFKSESQDICFVTGEHNNFLKKNLILKKGEIKNSANNTIGYHNGLPLYTIGQRKGIEIDSNGPYYVTQIDYKNNILKVTNNPVDKILYTDEFEIINTNWISKIPNNHILNCECITRYGQKTKQCTVEKLNNNKYLVKLKEKQRAITKGQSAVFYNKNKLLGGGIIIT